eukprot:scaffold15108_cov180-Amphora_coffeaeformis.AAC.22
MNEDDQQTTSKTKKNPFATLWQDWQAAKAAKDANAPFCTLMTIQDDGFPTGRILGLRDIRINDDDNNDNDGALVVYVSKTSPKWQQLSSSSNSNSGKYEILLFWTQPRMLQYRLSGTAWTAVDDTELQEQYELYKPQQSKYLDYYYAHHQAQSTVLEGGRSAFVETMQQIKAHFETDDDKNRTKPVPFSADVAGGLILQPSRIEEWRASPQDRWHERYRHEKTNGGSEWSTQALVP